MICQPIRFSQIPPAYATWATHLSPYPINYNGLNNNRHSTVGAAIISFTRRYDRDEWMNFLLLICSVIEVCKFWANADVLMLQ
jgi:hypothetical protein